MKQTEVLNLFKGFLNLIDEEIDVRLGEEDEDYVIVMGYGEEDIICNKLNELMHHLKPGSFEYEHPDRINWEYLEKTHRCPVYITFHKYEEVSLDSLVQAMKISEVIYTWSLKEAAELVRKFSTRRY